jgi:hypothetical protein
MSPINLLARRRTEVNGNFRVLFVGLILVGIYFLHRHEKHRRGEPVSSNLE